MRKSIYLFRRDLRYEDNNGWNKCCNESDKVYPVFVATKEQIDNNPYRSDRAVEFMFKCLEDLQVNILYGYGALEELITSGKYTHVYAVMDYTPYARSRDKSLRTMIEKYSAEFITIEDSLIYPIGTILTKTGTCYQKFTPFYEASKGHDPIISIKIDKGISKGIVKGSDISRMKSVAIDKSGKKSTTIDKGTNTSMIKSVAIDNRSIALKLLRDLKEYDHDNLEKETSRLSAYIKFGCVSIREVIKAVKGKSFEEVFVRQLVWRDFYYNIVWFYPHVLGTGNKNFNQKYVVVWSKDIERKDLWRRWKTGKTYVPLVDAAMNQLNETGYMHNRARLVVASYLVKSLGINWTAGEKYFAKKLIDYDPAINNGNWQWVAGSGVDSQPYFRIFNPWLQAKRHDPNAIYIKKWLPSLKHLPAKTIHNPDLMKDLYGETKELDKKEILSMYAKI